MNEGRFRGKSGVAIGSCIYAIHRFGILGNGGPQEWVHIYPENVTNSSNSWKGKKKQDHALFNQRSLGYCRVPYWDREILIRTLEDVVFIEIE